MVSKYLIGALGGFLVSICGGLIGFIFGPIIVKDQVHKVCTTGELINHKFFL